MRVFVDHKTVAGTDDTYQIFIEETTGKAVDMEELTNRIIVDSYEDKYGKLILVLTDHTFEDRTK